MSTQPSPTRTTLTDGGLETVLIFHHGQELPEFAAFHLLKDEAGRQLLRDYNRQHLDIAEELGTAFNLGAPTWRANPDWGEKIGYSPSELRTANERAFRELHLLREEYKDRIPDIGISGCVGPRGDGYSPSALMSADEARAYHAPQIQLFANQGADTFAAMTMNYVEEAVGIARAARAANIPAMISFTVETDGRLPNGNSLREAIERTDAESDRAVDSFMINCAHPTHFDSIFQEGGDWLLRIKGIRANASRLSHAELDESEHLDEGDPLDLADRLRRLKTVLPNLSVFGGCCGTDHRHIRAIGEACRS
jgi:homocysteine S-methyltransferase